MKHVGLSRISLIVMAPLLMPVGQAVAQQCGGDFSSFLAGVKQEAAAKGLPAQAINTTLGNARLDKKVLQRDRSQSVFRQDFLTFSKRTVSGSRLDIGRKKMNQNANIFAKAKSAYGVPPEVITAFWGLETDYGVVQGDFNTVNALATLSHDCRRPQQFRPHLIGAIAMNARGELDPQRTKGAWAGEVGQVQMLPADIIAFGVDGDGNGRVDLQNSTADTILTAARYIQHLGWVANQPWLQEVVAPANFPWEQSGLGTRHPVSQWARWGVQPRQGSLPSGNLPASLILPMGHKGPAFLAYPNFQVYLKWNKSFVYTTSAAYFATRLGGASRYNAGNPDPMLSSQQMVQLQKRLAAKGYDVGGADGILGRKTRDAVRAEQQRNGLPADGWPTKALLSKV